MTPVELLARREALGVSLNALSEVWGMRYQSIARWEFGRAAPKDWAWIEESLTHMEEYQDDLVAELVEVARTLHTETGEAALVTFHSRGAFYRWHPEAREKQWRGSGKGVPVELHRTAAARAAYELRTVHGLERVTISAAPDPEAGAE